MSADELSSARATHFLLRHESFETRLCRWLSNGEPAPQASNGLAPERHRSGLARVRFPARSVRQLAAPDRLRPENSALPSGVGGKSRHGSIMTSTADGN